MPRRATKLVKGAQLVFNEADWEYLGEGTYNQVFRSKYPLKLDAGCDYEGYWVVKFPKLKCNALERFRYAEFLQLLTEISQKDNSKFSNEVNVFLSEVAKIDKHKYKHENFNQAEVHALGDFLRQVGAGKLADKLSTDVLFDPFVGHQRELRILTEMYGDRGHIPHAKMLRSANLDPTLESSYAWAVPYIDGLQATDDEMAAEVVNIYRKTRRVVVDAPAKKNFLTVRNADGTKATFCVDVDWALRRTNSRLSIEAGGVTESETVFDIYNGFWEEYIDRYPHTISTLITLLVLEQDWNPAHEMDALITPYVVDGLRYFRKLPKTERQLFSKVLLENIHFFERQGIELDDYWCEAIGVFSRDQMLISDSALSMLDVFSTLASDSHEERLACFEVMASCVARDINFSPRDVRAIGRRFSQGETLKQQLSSYIVMPMETEEDDTVATEDESKLAVTSLSRVYHATKPQGLFASCHESAKQEAHAHESALGWAARHLGLGGLFN